MILDGQNVLKNIYSKIFNTYDVVDTIRKKKICMTFTLVLMIGYQKNSIQTIL